jgi:hypothetical protein
METIKRNFSDLLLKCANSRKEQTEKVGAM